MNQNQLERLEAIEDIVLEIGDKLASDAIEWPWLKVYLDHLREIREESLGN